jgi:hypothetical protein
VAGGCAAPPTGGPATDTPREAAPAHWYSLKRAPAPSGPTIKSAELDELTRAFADRYVGLLSSACDALKKDNSDLVQRREAQKLLVNGATNVYDIASNADAFTRVLDLVVVTTLISQVWIDDDLATEVFGDRAEIVIRALHHGRVEAWALAAQVLRPDQLDLLDYLLWEWRRQNPDMMRAYSVRFSNFAIGRGRSSAAEVLAAGGLFGQVAQAGQAVGEARLLSERVFYQLKREPTLLRWQAEAAQDTALATPEVGNALRDMRRLADLPKNLAAEREAMLATPQVGKALEDMHRMAEQAEQLPKNVAAERQALVTALDERMKQADATIAGVKSALDEAKEVLASVGPVSDSLKEMFKTANILFARHESGDKGTTAAAPASRPFDIREYTEAMKELATTAGQVNEVLKSSNDLLRSPEWDRRVEQVSTSADERVRRAVKESQQVVNDFFWRVYAALSVLFVLLIICLGTAFVLMRRLFRRVASNTAVLRSEDGRIADLEADPGTSAAGAGRKEGHP